MGARGCSHRFGPLRHNLAFAQPGFLPASIGPFHCHSAPTSPYALPSTSTWAFLPRLFAGTPPNCNKHPCPATKPPCFPAYPHCLLYRCIYHTARRVRPCARASEQSKVSQEALVVTSCQEDQLEQTKHRCWMSTGPCRGSCGEAAQLHAALCRQQASSRSRARSARTGVASIVVSPRCGWEAPAGAGPVETGVVRGLRPGPRGCLRPTSSCPTVVLALPRSRGQQTPTAGCRRGCGGQERCCSCLPHSRLCWSPTSASVRWGWARRLGGSAAAPGGTGGVVAAAWPSLPLHSLPLHLMHATPMVQVHPSTCAA